MFDWLHKTFSINFLYFVTEIFASWKKTRNIYTRKSQFTFPGEDVID